LQVGPLFFILMTQPRARVSPERIPRLVRVNLRLTGLPRRSPRTGFGCFFFELVLRKSLIRVLLRFARTSSRTAFNLTYWRYVSDAQIPEPLLHLPFQLGQSLTKSHLNRLSFTHFTSFCPAHSPERGNSPQAIYSFPLSFSRLLCRVILDVSP